MALPSINPTTTKAWKKLEAHFENVKGLEMKDLFAQNKERANQMAINWEDFYVDYSKNRITSETIKLLLELAEETKLKDAIQAQFSGEVINKTEGREVLHTALRAKATDTIVVEGKNVMPEIFEVKQKIETFSNQVISGALKGYTNKVFKTWLT